MNYLDRKNITEKLRVYVGAIQNPTYVITDDNIHDINAWMFQNRANLEAYFELLEVQPEEEHICSLIQYERARAIYFENLRELQEELYQSQYSYDDERTERFSMYDNNTGMPIRGEI